MFIDFVIFRGQFRTALYRSHVYFKWRSRFSGTHAIPGSSESFPQEDEVTAGHQTTMRCTWPHGGLSVYEPAVVCVCVCVLNSSGLHGWPPGVCLLWRTFQGQESDSLSSCPQTPNLAKTLPLHKWTLSHNRSVSFLPQSSSDPSPVFSVSLTL